MSRVFMCSRPRADMDVSAAQRYGTIIYLMDGKVPAFHTNDYMRLVIDTARAYDFDADSDYVCLTGQVVPVTLMVSALLYEYDHLQALLFNANTETYEARDLRVEEEATT